MKNSEFAGKYLKFPILVTAVCGMSMPALAGANLSIPLDVGQSSAVMAATYSCKDGTLLPVQYINTDANNLALIPIDGSERVFVNVISASGARYVSGPFEFWSKGDSASLTNALNDKDNKECETKAQPAAQ